MTMYPSSISPRHSIPSLPVEDNKNLQVDLPKKGFIKNIISKILPSDSYTPHVVPSVSARLSSSPTNVGQLPKISYEFEQQITGGKAFTGAAPPSKMEHQASRVLEVAVSQISAAVDDKSEAPLIKDETINIPIL
jgi:hypothetical protein